MVKGKLLSVPIASMFPRRPRSRRKNSGDQASSIKLLATVAERVHKDEEEKMFNVAASDDQLLPDDDSPSELPKSSSQVSIYRDADKHRKDSPIESSSEMLEQTEIVKHVNVGSETMGLCSEGIIPIAVLVDDDENSSQCVHPYNNVGISSIREFDSSKLRSVRLSIKSFQVPELFVEIPGSETIGSLKQTISEAISAMTGDGLSVDVLLQGKKLCDDTQTLGQVGISCGSEFGDIAFALGPNRTRALSETAETGIKGGAIEVQSVVQSKNMEDLKQLELRRRRIRVPFSIPEVEALVEAVEKLGLGRWRDVKLWAFGNASHRTYVDLKDKWKTLVRTAGLAPQQRRGEQVPQQLLDRVLSAHIHWSEEQRRQMFQIDSGPDGERVT